MGEWGRHVIVARGRRLRPAALPRAALAALCFFIAQLAILPPARAQDGAGGEAALAGAWDAVMRMMPPAFTPALTADSVAAAHRTVLFASLESGPGQRFTGSGVKHAPFGALGESGLRVLARGGAGQWQDRRKLFESEAKTDSALMIGIEQMTGRGAFGLYAGAELTTTSRTWMTRAARFAADRRAVQQRETQGEGFRLQLDIWDHPTPETLLHIGLAGSSARGEFWGRAAAGYRLDMPALPRPVLSWQAMPTWTTEAASPVFLGPEAELVMSRSYTKWRIGGHVTGLKLLGFTLRLAAGHEQATDGLRGLYVTGGLHWSR